MPNKTPIKRRVHELYILIKHSSLVFFIQLFQKRLLL